MAIPQLQSLVAFVDQFWVGQRVSTVILSGFGFLALVLAALGTYGVLALVLVLAARGGSLAAIAEPGRVAAVLIAAHAASRGGLAPIMWLLPPARSDGLAAATGRPAAGDAATAVIFGIAAAFLLLDFAVAVTAILACAVVQAVLALQARRQIGGVTGDVLGAAQQLGEVAVLLVAAAGAAA